MSLRTPILALMGFGAYYIIRVTLCISPISIILQKTNEVINFVGNSIFILMYIKVKI